MAEPGQTVLRVVNRIDGVPTPADGGYIVEYDPRLGWEPSWQAGSPWDIYWAGGYDRRFKLVTSADIKKARGFPSLVEALEYWRQVCPNEPRRPDGRPNRPLTAFTCEVARA